MTYWSANMNMLALLFLCKRKDYFMAESITDEQILENYLKELKKFNIFKILYFMIIIYFDLGFSFFLLKRALRPISAT